MEIFSTDFLRVRVDQEGKRICVTCHKPFNSADFRQGLLLALRHATTNGVKQWLLDFRAIGELSEEEDTWIQVQLFPQLMISLGYDNYMAIVVEEGCYTRLLHEFGRLGLKSYNSYIVINTFWEIEQAQLWLDQAASPVQE